MKRRPNLWLNPDAWQGLGTLRVFHPGPLVKSFENIQRSDLDTDPKALNSESLHSPKRPDPDITERPRKSGVEKRNTQESPR